MTKCIVLAAGNSQRFGSQKMLYPLANREPMLSVTISLYRQVFDEVTVVVRSKTNEVASLAAEAGASLIASPSADLGMSQSLIAGVKAHANAGRWLIALGDMPYVLPSSLRLMLEDKHMLVAPSLAGKRGNPVIFDASYKPQLLALTGDNGGRSIVENNSDALGLVRLNDPGVLYDIDSVGDVRPQQG